MKQSWIQRWPITLVVLSVLLMSVSGCAGGARPMSWTGLTVVDEMVYAPDLEQFRVLNAADGEPVWVFPKSTEDERRGVFYVTPAVDEKHVIVASQVPASGFFSQAKNVVWALERDTGTLLWRFDEAGGQYVEGGVVGGGLFIIGNSDGNVYALDVETGTPRWVFETGHRVWATPLIVSDTVYVGSMDRHLYSLNLSDGQVQWDFSTLGAFASEPAMWNDTLYIGAFDDKLYAVDALTGAERWHFAGENWFWGDVAVHDGTIYATDVNGNVHAVDAETGEQIWHQALDAPLRAGPVLTEDGSQMFVGSENGTLYAMDTSDGFVMWRAENDKAQILSPPVVSGSNVYVALLYGEARIQALHVDNGREIWVHPPAVEAAANE